MNKVILLGRLTRDPESRWTQKQGSQEQTCVARFTLAVDRRGRDQGADFITCVVFGKSAENAEKYLKKGLKIALSGRIQTGSYTNRDNVKVYTTDVVVEEWEFAESKAASDNYRGGNFGGQAAPSAPTAGGSGSADGFMNIPDGIDEDLPFN